jgi:hypothetical protein
VPSSAPSSRFEITPDGGVAQEMDAALYCIDHVQAAAYVTQDKRWIMGCDVEYEVIQRFYGRIITEYKDIRD